MSDIILDGEDYDEFVARTDNATHGDAVACNEAFVAAMTKAIKRGREKAVFGTYFDASPPVGAKKLRGILPASACGSPAAMCMEASVPQIGSVSLMK